MCMVDGGKEIAGEDHGAFCRIDEDPLHSPSVTDQRLDTNAGKNLLRTVDQSHSISDRIEMRPKVGPGHGAAIGECIIPFLSLDDDLGIREDDPGRSTFRRHF